jgi:hypothetical protein
MRIWRKELNILRSPVEHVWNMFESRETFSVDKRRSR